MDGALLTLRVVRVDDARLRVPGGLATAEALASAGVHLDRVRERRGGGRGNAQAFIALGAAGACGGDQTFIALGAAGTCGGAQAFTALSARAWGS